MDLEEQVARFRGARLESGFLLDFDGTLAPIVADPARARLHPRAGATLEGLSLEYGVLAVVSARRAEFIAEAVGLEHVRYIGLYGAEHIADGRLIQAVDAERWRGMASRLARDAQALIVTEGLEGCMVELKDLTLSLHFRRARDLGVGSLLLEWAQQAAPKRGFAAALGRKVVEMKPIGVGKARVLEQLLEEVSHLIVAGDDSGDVETMQLARDRFSDRVTSIAVISDESPEGLRDSADHWVSSIDELLDVLERFL